MTTLDASTTDLLRKVWALTDSPADGEAHAAFGKTRAIVVRAGGKLRDLPDMLGSSGGGGDDDALRMELWTARMEAISARTDCFNARTKLKSTEWSLERVRCEVHRLEAELKDSKRRHPETGSHELYVARATIAAYENHERRHAADRAAKGRANRENLAALRLALREAARKRIPADEAYRVWLTTSHPALDMQWPVDVCVDEAGLQQCIRALGGK